VLPLSLILLTLTLSLAYALIIQQSLAGWNRISRLKLPPGFQPQAFISILLPARNEAKNIAACLESIKALNYPAHLFEVIVIDDHSEDATAAVVEAYPGVRLLRLVEYLKADEEFVAYKKKAIELGVAHAKGALILTTDADCVVPPNWLHYMAYAYEVKKAKLIAGPVLFHGEKNAFERFQSLDYAGMMLFTGAALRGRRWPMGNGANLAYQKELFEKLKGYDGARDLASGDDVLLIQKVMEQEPDALMFLKQKKATVRTTAKPDWRSFLQQRIRWGTKNSRFPSLIAAWMIGTVFLFSYGIVFSFLAIPFYPALFLPLFAFSFLCKVICDFLFLRSATFFFGRPELLRGFLLSEVLHTLYIVIVGTGSLFIKQYHWKGRSVK